MWRQGNISTDSWTEGSSGHSWFWQATLACLPLSNEALALAGGWGTHHHFTSTTGCMYHKHHNAWLPWLQNCTMCLQRLLSASLRWLLLRCHFLHCLFKENHTQSSCTTLTCCKSIPLSKCKPTAMNGKQYVVTLAASMAVCVLLSVIYCTCTGTCVLVKV